MHLKINLYIYVNNMSNARRKVIVFLVDGKYIRIPVRLCLNHFISLECLIHLYIC